MRNAAMQEALRSTMRYRHGALITKGGKILGQGHNHIRTGFSGPLSAHDAIVLPSERGENYTLGCDHSATQDDARSMGGRPSACHSYFSMHAEMHAITTMLRGARPHVARSSVQLLPSVSDVELDGLFDQTSSLTLLPPRSSNTLSAGSRCSDVPTATPAMSGRVSAANIKTKCNRALVEGAKREQQRIAFSAQNEWGLKPGYKKRAEEKPTPHPRRSNCYGARVWPVGW